MSLLAQASDEILSLLASAQKPLTIPELTESLRVHPNTVRARLTALIDEGLIERETVTPEGRGRPGHVYALSHDGHRAVSGRDVVQEYRGLSAAFAEHVARNSSDPAQDARMLGRSWGAELADASGSPQGADDGGASPHTRTLHLLEQMRFSPVVEHDGVALQTCPLLELATRLPEVVCAVHRGLIEGAVQEFSDSDEEVEVELSAFTEPGACRLRWSETDAM